MRWEAGSAGLPFRTTDFEGESKVKKWLHMILSKSLLQRFLLSFLALSLIPLIVVTVAAQRNAEKGFMDYAYQQADSTMDLVAYNINRQFERYNNLTYFLTRDKQLSELVSAQALQRYQQDSIYSRHLSTLLDGYRESVYNVQFCGVVYENGLVVASSGKSAIDMRYTRQEWYQQCIRSADQIQTLAFGSGENPFEDIFISHVNTILFCKAIPDLNGRPGGVVFVCVSGNILEESTSSIADRKGSFVYILDRSGWVVHSPIEHRIPQLPNPDMFVHLSRELPSANWTLYGEICIELSIQQIRSTQRASWTIAAVLIVIVFIISIATTRQMLKPIYALNQSMQKAQQGDLAVRCEERGPEELKGLAIIFNGMLQRIQSLLNQVYTEQRNKRKAEMAALQANIKPHFLYNTLDTLCWMAMQYKAYDVVETVEALSNLFRISLSKGSETIPLENEILHVTSYLQIQKVRYESKMEFEICCDENCHGLKVQKLILQPVVENALYHGIKESEHNGTIWVHVYRDEKMLYLRVEDDGIGMRPERLEEVQNVLKGCVHPKSGVYGIVNVQERLVLSYGSEYGVILESTYGKGTVCTIRHPLLEE